MPEIKNTFLAGKMNKDRDLRLVPEGEYLEALNIQITKSEANDVGVIQNIVGNQLAHTSLGLAAGYEVIGSFFDERNNRIFWFVTNDTNNYIYLWNVGDANATAIVSGTFLNFNKQNKITGVNLLEDLLFWTDNRNQPRRINIVTAIGNNSYYNSEVKVSVAKVAPWKCPSIISATHNAEIQSRLMEEEFVRFAYRYKFKNNEYSIISPFSQIVFELGDSSTSTNVISQTDEDKILQSTENFKFKNRVNQVTLGIDVFSTNPIADYEIVAVDVLYKESDSLAIRVVDTIKLTDGLASSTYQYIYKSTPPKSTLPEDQLTRAFDNVPVKALAQEIAGNRVIYGNFTQNYSLPTLDYDVFCTIKDDSEYPHHSVKQRRDYEVGIVLADKYGRTSPVILSDTSRITVEAKNENFDSLSWPGDSIKIVFNSDITGDDIYDPNSTTNDLGWYSYRVVVKQADQEYYNVYNPGITKGYLTIHNDNINKVPRNTDDSIDADNLYPTSARLYPKVVNVATTTSQALQQEMSDEGLYNIESIGTADAFDLYDADSVDQSKGFYEQRKFHLLGKLEEGITGNNINTTFNGVLSVFETEPFRSTLDIYYETSTSDLIQNLNDSPNAQIADILVEPDGYGTGTEGDVFIPESTPSGSYVARLRVIDLQSGLDIPNAVVTLNSPGQFSIEKDPVDGYYKVKTAQSFVFSSTPANNEYSISITSGNFTVSNNTITITNSSPTVSGINSVSVAKDIAGLSTVFTQNATNGSSSLTGFATGLSVSHVEVHGVTTHTDNIFTSSINTNTGVITVAVISSGISASHHGEYIRVDLTVTDSGGLTAEKSVTVYVSNTSGGTGLTAVNLKFDLNANEYSNSASACLSVNLFPSQGDFYVDAADVSSITGTTILYGTPDGSRLAVSGWYANPDGSWTGRWLRVESGDGYIGYWDIAPTNCTT